MWQRPKININYATHSLRIRSYEWEEGQEMGRGGVEAGFSSCWLSSQQGEPVPRGFHGRFLHMLPWRGTRLLCPYVLQPWSGLVTVSLGALCSVHRGVERNSQVQLKETKYEGRLHWLKTFKSLSIHPLLSPSTPLLSLSGAQARVLGGSVCVERSSYRPSY